MPGWCVTLTNAKIYLLCSLTNVMWWCQILCFSRRHVITSHYLKKNDKCSRFSRKVNTLEISILQWPFLLKWEWVLFYRREKKKQTSDTSFKNYIKPLYDRCFKFIKRRNKVGKGDTADITLGLPPCMFAWH